METIKNSIVFISAILGFLGVAFGIISIIEYKKIEAQNEYLEKRIQEQELLIDYLKGNSNE